MYLDFHGFQEKPFNLTPDPRFVFLSKSHREAFAHLLYGINNRMGFMVLTGEVGSGKTTVLRALLNQLDPDRFRTALIFNPCLSAPELLRTVNREFGLSTDPPQGSGFLDILNTFLLQENAEGRTVVLAIDEAQNLEAQVLEQIRLISNLETDREKLIQIVLSGQPELAQILKRNEMRQLSQRITVWYHLQPLDFEDTVHYIHHRLEVAGRRGRSLFSNGAMKRIYRYSRGLPRLINTACDRALLAGYTKDTPTINTRTAAEGIKDVRKMASFYSRKRSLILIPSFVVLAALLLASGIYYKKKEFIDSFHRLQRIEAKEEVAKKEPVIVVPKIDPVVTGEALSRAVADEFAKPSESESARRAFNRLAAFWNASAVSNGNLGQVSEMEQAALDRELHLYRFSGNLGALLRIDQPAALELTLPGISGKRFVTLVGLEGEQLLIDPPVAERKTLPPNEIEKHWTGRGFLLWKDHLRLPPMISPGSRGNFVRQLQDLLAEAGVYNRPSTGVFDENTLSAVKAFQSSKGIGEDGIVGGQTLMLLYHSIDRFKTPKLKTEQK
jgi:general secretion pathway protein A